MINTHLVKVAIEQKKEAENTEEVKKEEDDKLLSLYINNFNKYFRQFLL